MCHTVEFPTFPALGMDTSYGSGEGHSSVHHQGTGPHSKTYFKTMSTHCPISVHICFVVMPCSMPEAHTPKTTCRGPLHPHHNHFVNHCCLPNQLTVVECFVQRASNSRLQQQTEPPAHELVVVCD